MKEIVCCVISTPKLWHFEEFADILGRHPCKGTSVREVWKIQLRRCARLGECQLSAPSCVTLKTALAPLSHCFHICKGKICINFGDAVLEMFDAKST